MVWVSESALQALISLEEGEFSGCPVCRKARVSSHCVHFLICEVEVCVDWGLAALLESAGPET